MEKQKPKITGTSHWLVCLTHGMSGLTALEGYKEQTRNKEQLLTLFTEQKWEPKTNRHTVTTADHVVSEQLSN